ncbi:MAG: phasin family protein [Gammaproteobacteria bacterium]|nr:phasin family protein [Gammaproteobacteria bacterium]
MAQQFAFPQAEEFLAPFKAFNELALANAEKLVALQSKNFEKYSQLALSNLQEAVQVSDLEQSKAYFAKQGDLSKQVAEDLTADLKEVIELGQAFTADVQKLMSENVAKANSSVKPVAPVKTVKKAA